ncbi:hypothetical protein [Desertivirga arenae]|uniref:hypothetical protein n=1 Tax=Desertivirga arenae TaxID=2810309 RepID=UPI001A96030D|nr:hypothetical protein [Pedobacter sp. SYSU D00823]
MKFRIFSIAAITAAILQLGCNNRTPKTFEEIPIEMQPDWKGIDISELPVKFGQILRFKKDSNVIDAIIVDFDKDERGIWIGLCFINKTKLFGRQIPSAWISSQCLNLLDLAYLNTDGLKQYEVISQIKVDRGKVGIGSITPVSNVNELMVEYENGIKQRKKKQTPCNEELTDEKSVRECYFDVETIKQQ